MTELPRLQNGSVYRVRYRDPVLFRDQPNPGDFRPFIRECVGWLTEKSDCVNIIFERFSEPDTLEGSKQRASAFSIPKQCIVEAVKIG